MGYIQIPKLSGGDDEPVITARDMPQEWEYFKTLAENNTDQCYLFFAGASGTFIIDGLFGDAYVTVYGGANGTTPLYRCFWNNDGASRYWAHYENGAWVRNTNQPSTSDFSVCNFAHADLDNYDTIFPVTFQDLTGKQVTNDPHIKTTQLFTVVAHEPSNIGYNNGVLKLGATYGSTNTNGALVYPLVAYYGPPGGPKSETTLRTPDLEFVFYNSDTHSVGSNSCYGSYYLGKINIPDTVTSMFDYNFAYCYNLQEAVISSNITDLYDSTFSSCFKLKKVNIKGNVTTIGNNVFRTTKSLEKLTLPNTVTSLGDYCFSASGIEKLNFPSTLTTLGAYCFQSSALKEAVLPDTVTTVGNYAFTSCEKLEKVHLPNTITTIEDYMFSECSLLSDINIPSSLTTIGQYAFQGCKNLPNITLPSTLTSIGNNAFSGCYSITEATIPNGCTLDTHIFYQCENLKKVSLPNDLTIIPNYCFYFDRTLEEINLPNTVTSIMGYAFYGTWSIKKMIFPTSITSLAANGCGGMGGCRYFKFLGTPATLANVNFFAACNTYAKILIPYEYIADYKTATNWKATTNNLVKRQRGFKTFQQGETLPSTDSTGTYNLKWYADLDAVLATAVGNFPTDVPEITVAPSDGEYYCYIY